MSKQLINQIAGEIVVKAGTRIFAQMRQHCRGLPVSAAIEYKRLVRTPQHVRFYCPSAIYAVARRRRRSKGSVNFAWSRCFVYEARTLAARRTPLQRRCARRA